MYFSQIYQAVAKMTGTPTRSYAEIVATPSPNLRVESDKDKTVEEDFPQLPGM